MNQPQQNHQTQFFWGPGAEAKALGPQAEAEGLQKNPAALDEFHQDVLAKPVRRQFGKEKILEILTAYDQAPWGERGSILRSYGVFTSQIQNWRHRFEAGTMANKDKNTGKKNELHELKSELARKDQKIRKLEEYLQAQTIVIDALKKISDSATKLENDRQGNI